MNVFRKAKQKLLSMISRELRAEARLREDAEKRTTAYKTMLDRALQFVEELDYWRAEANKKERLFADIVREVDGAEDLHNLRQTVRLMAYRAENSGIVVAADPEDVPTVIVTDERVV